MSATTNHPAFKSQLSNLIGYWGLIHVIEGLAEYTLNESKEYNNQNDRLYASVLRFASKHLKETHKEMYNLGW